MNRIFSFRNTKVAVILAFVTMVILQACSQATTAPLPTNTDLLTKPTWVVSSIAVNGTIMRQPGTQTYKFNADGTGNTASAGIVQAITWSFQNQEKSLRFGITGLTLPTWEIDQLTNTSMVLSMTSAGATVVITFTVQ